MKRVLITGAAGFIGIHMVKECLKRGYYVVGIDDLNNFTYSAKIKYDRLSSIGIDVGQLDRSSYVQTGNLEIQKLDITETPTIKANIIDGNYDLVLHLAGMTSVSASSLSPFVFFKVNVNGFLNVLDGIRDIDPIHRPRFVFASSAAVYGNAQNKKLVEDDKNLIHPDSIYGATKSMCEDAAETYAKLYNMQSLAVRFFNIYGPFARPDTLSNIVTEDLYSGEIIPVYNNGDISHDFMYIDDCIEDLCRICFEVPETEPKFEAINVGTNSPVAISDFISTLEKLSGRKALIRYEPLPEGEIQSLTADTTKFERIYGKRDYISIGEGLHKYFDWFKAYYKNFYDFSV